jgi:hypothetical protein
VTISIRILLQETWELKLAWDDVLPHSIQERSKEFLEEMQSALRVVHIPRSLHLTTLELELHGFGDASLKAYCGVIYLNFPHGARELVLARARVCPVRKHTLPRLELLAALLTARMLTTVAQELELTQPKLRAWTDSTIVLHWIASEKPLEEFVANRVSEIKRLIPPGNWNHVEGAVNPADLGTRGITAQALENNDLWWHGPSTVLSGQYEAEVKELPFGNSVIAASVEGRDKVRGKAVWKVPAPSYQTTPQTICTPSNGADSCGSHEPI